MEAEKEHAPEQALEREPLMRRKEEPPSGRCKSGNGLVLFPRRGFVASSFAPSSLPRILDEPSTHRRILQDGLVDRKPRVFFLWGLDTGL